MTDGVMFAILSPIHITHMIVTVCHDEWLSAVLVLLCLRHFCHLAAQNRKWSSQEYTIHNGDGHRHQATSVFLTLTSTGDWMAPWAIRSTENLPTQTSTKTPDHTTIPLTDKPFCQLRCTQPGLCVTTKASRPLQGKIGIFWSRYDMPSTWRLEPQSQMTSPPQSLSCLMSRQHMAGSAECWQTQHQMSWPAA